MLACAVAALAQERPLRFQGEVKRGQEFQRDIGRGLVFALRTQPDGWIIEVTPTVKGACSDFSDVIAIPLRGYKQSDLNTGFSTTAAESLKISPRQIRFVLNEADCKREDEWATRLMWSYSYTAKEVQEAREKFGASPSGKIVLNILDSKVAPSGGLGDGNDFDAIEWVKFEVEVTFPKKP